MRPLLVSICKYGKCLAILACILILSVEEATSNDHRSRLYHGTPLEELSENCGFLVWEGHTRAQPIENFPVLIQLDRNLPPHIMELARIAIREWNNAWLTYLWDRFQADPWELGKIDHGILDVYLFTWIVPQNDLKSNKNDRVNAVVLSNNPRRNRRAFATAIVSSDDNFSSTQIFSPGVPITDADIEIYLHRHSRINYYHSKLPKKNEIDALTVMMHELGHVLGLVHKPADGTHVLPSQKGLMNQSPTRGVRHLPGRSEFDDFMCVYGIALHHHYSDGGPARRNRNK